MAKRMTEIINGLIADIPNMKIMGEESHEFNLWREKVDAVCRNVLGEGSEKYRRTRDFFYPSFFVLPAGTSYERHNLKKGFIDSLDVYKKILDSLLFEVELNEGSDDSDAIALVKHILNSFPKFARQIVIRHENRPSIEFKDEYDVQDALHAILLLHYDNIKREEPIPHSAGASSSIDFLLRKEGIGIEVKMPRKGLRDKALGGQLAEDKERYKKEKDCKTLIFFIYDPNHYINNPSEIVQDISGEVYGMNVMVIYSPTL